MEITDAKTLSNEIPDQQTFDMSEEKIFELSTIRLISGRHTQCWLNNEGIIIHTRCGSVSSEDFWRLEAVPSWPKIYCKKNWVINIESVNYSWFFDSSVASRARITIKGSKSRPAMTLNVSHVLDVSSIRKKLWITMQTCLADSIARLNFASKRNSVGTLRRLTLD